MFISPTEILSLLEHYKYLVIFPIAIVEGPIIIITTGFLVYLGVLNAFIAYTMLVVADSLGDSLYYCVGKYWGKSRFIRKVGRYIGYNEKSEEYLENHFRRHKVKTFLLAKVSHGLGGSVQIASGIARVRYLEFLELNLIGTMPKVLALLVVGFYVGGSYVKIDNYLDLIGMTIITVAVLVLAYIVGRRLVVDYLSK